MYPMVLMTLTIRLSTAVYVLSQLLIALGTLGS